MDKGGKMKEEGGGLRYEEGYKPHQPGAAAHDGYIHESVSRGSTATHKSSGNKSKGRRRYDTKGIRHGTRRTRNNNNCIHESVSRGSTATHKGSGNKSKERRSYDTKGIRHGTRRTRNNNSSPANLRNSTREINTERPPKHKVATKGREEARTIVKRHKGPVVTNKGGKMKARCEAKREGTGDDTKGGGDQQQSENDYLLAEPRLAEAHDTSTVVHPTGADRSDRHKGRSH